MRVGKQQRVGIAVMLAGGLLLQATAAAQDAGGGAAGVTFFTGPNFTGNSKTLTLAPGQPFAAIPYVGDELNEKIASLRADPGIGVALFQQPYFASRDDACGPNLGTAENPDAWWTGLTADFEPPYLTDQTYEVAETADDDYSSVIAYRRDMGPPPAFLLLERRSYYNRSCERSADQSYFNRIVIPVPNPPQREACTDLSLPASSPGADSDAPRFVRVSEAVALQPQAFSTGYQPVGHRFILTLFDGPDCSGSSITLPSSEDGRPASYRLSDFDFDRKVRSVAIRYQRGPLDPFLSDASAPAEVALTPAPAAPQPTPQPAPQAPPQPATQQPSASQPVPAPAPATDDGLQPPPSPPAQPQQQAVQPAQPQVAPAPVPAPAADGGLQPPPPSAPAQPQQQQALQPVPQPQVAPAPAPVPAPARPTGPQEETFRFPVHQVYRLNYCLQDEQGCGEPAATAWCKNQGFNRATRWTQEDNIGALYPTVFIGSGSICDKFLCDGFEEITCSQ